MASNTAKTMQLLHLGSMLNLFPVLLLISFGFVLGKIGSATFSPESYLPNFRALSPTPASKKACVKLPTFMESGRLTASSGGPMHNMTDEELLWRASMEPRRSTRVSTVPKVTFLLYSLELFIYDSVYVVCIPVTQNVSELFLFLWV
jgi:hypothetical protein